MPLEHVKDEHLRFDCETLRTLWRIISCSDSYIFKYYVPHSLWQRLFKPLTLLLMFCTSYPQHILKVKQSPEGSRKLRFPYFTTTAQDGGKVVSLTDRPPLPPRNVPGTHFCEGLSRPQGHTAIGWIMSVKNSNDTIGNRTRNFPDFGAVPQPTASPFV